MEIESILQQSDPTVGTAIPSPDSPEGVDIKAQALEASAHSAERTGGGRRVRRITVPIAALTAVAAAIVLLVTLLPAQLGTQGSKAAAALIELASAARSQPILGPGQYDYTETEQQPTGVSASGAAGRLGGWTQYSVGTVQTWIAANGAGRQVTTTDLNPEFMSPADKRNWAKAGGEFDEPPTYVVTEEDFGPGGSGLSSNQFHESRPRPYDVASLPTDPTRLARTLCSSRMWKALPTADASVVGYGIEEPQASKCQLFGIVVSLLKGPDIGSTPALRQALFNVLAGVPGVRLLGSRSDAAGSRGVELQLVDRTPAGSTRITCANQTPAGPVVTKKVEMHNPATSTIFTVVVDPSTGTLLSLERSSLPKKIAVNEPCMHIPGGTQLSEQITDRSVLLSAGVVDSTSAVAKGTVTECAAGSIPEPPWDECHGARNDGDT